MPFRRPAAPERPEARPNICANDVEDAIADFYDVRMTQAQNVPATTGPTTVSQDVLAGTLAALMPLGSGFMVFFGYSLMGAFGVILGLGGAAWWAYWWRNKHEAFFPKDLRGGSVGGVAALVALFGLLFFLSL